MKKDLYIIGAGNVGGFIAYHSGEMRSCNLKGFLDDDAAKHGQILYDQPVIGRPDDLLNCDKETDVAIAIANPVIKKKIITRLKQNPLISFPSFIHPKAWLGQKITWGEGCIVYPGATINYETRLGKFVTINMNAAIGHNCLVEDYATISPGVNCGGFTHIGEQSFLGIGSVTIQSIKTGKNTTIGAGAVVIRNLPDQATAVGNPARIIKK